MGGAVSRRTTAPPQARLHVNQGLAAAQSNQRFSVIPPRVPPLTELSAITRAVTYTPLAESAIRSHPEISSSMATRTFTGHSQRSTRFRFLSCQQIRATRAYTHSSRLLVPHQECKPGSVSAALTSPPRISTPGVTWSPLLRTVRNSLTVLSIS